MDAPAIRYAHAPDGTAIAFTVTGDGPPLLLCSSLASTIGFTPPSMSRSLDRFRTAVLDRRGFGHSARSAPYGIDALVGDAVSVADALEFERFHLVAYSVGALEAVRIALDYPSRVLGLLLHAPYPPDWYNQPRAQAWRAALATDWGWFAEAWTRTWGGPSQPATPEMIEHFKRTNDPEGFRAAVDAFVSASPPRLDGIRVPTLVIHRSAKWQSQEVAEAYARGIPGARLIVDDSTDVWRVSEQTEPHVREFLSATMPPQALDGQVPLRQEHQKSGIRLSPREREILQLLAGGYSNQQIAEQLVLSVLTVARHIHNIYEKLGVRNRAAAAAWAASERGR